MDNTLSVDFHDCGRYFDTVRVIEIRYVLCLPYFFGSGETTSWVWVRTWAFAKLCAMRDDPTPFMIGDPVCGILERVGSGDYPSSQIAGWRATTFSEIFF